VLVIQGLDNQGLEECDLYRRDLCSKGGCEKEKTGLEATAQGSQPSRDCKKVEGLQRVYVMECLLVRRERPLSHIGGDKGGKGSLQGRY
jgi:hypothetical protein